MKKIVFIQLVILLVVGCSKVPLQVSSLESTQNLDTKGIVYALPRTVIFLKVESAKHLVLPGPYAKYALKFLGISDAPIQRIDEWKIENIEVKSAVEADPSSLFAVKPSGDVRIDFLKLYKNGLIVPINAIESQSVANSNISKSVNDEIWFKDLSTEAFIGTQKASVYSRIQQDSGFIRVPLQKDIIVEKNLEEKAREAADFIFSIRKRRSEFLSVDADHNLNGEGLKVAFEELNRLENEYLSLFIGKIFTTNTTNYFEFIPSDNNGETAIIFRFSASKGVLPSSDLSGNPVLLKIEPEKMPESYQPFINILAVEKEKPLNDLIYYRIPLNVNLKISLDKNDLTSQRRTIHQYGPLLRIPARYLIKDNGFLISN